MSVRRFLSLGWLLFLAVSAAADEVVLRPTDTRFVRLSTEQGLSQDDVYCILQDHRRFIWFGTEEGLNRYDGYSFKVFKNVRGDPTSLPSNWILRLYEDHSNRLWVGTADGLSLFDPATETFHNFHPPGPPSTGLGSGSVSSIREDRRGRIWVGTLGGGLHRFEPTTGTFVTTYRHADHDPASLSHDQIHTLLEDHAGRIWVGTTQGLNRFDPERGTFERYLHSDDPASLGLDWVWDLAEDREGRIWVATFGGGLSVLDVQKRRFTRYQKENGKLPNDAVTSVLVDHQGVVWAGTDGSGLLRRDAHGEGFIAFQSQARDTSSLSKNLVRALYEDMQGNLWVGTFKGGVNVLQRNLQGFSLYTHNPFVPDSLSDGSAVNAVMEDREGSIWAAVSEGGLDRFDRSTGRFTHFRNDPGNPRSLSGDTIMCLYQDRRGRFWIGTHGTGLDRFDVKAGTFERFQHGPGNSLGNDYVWAITEDADGTLWLGTNGGLDHFDPETRRFTHYGHDADDEGSLSDSSVRALVVAPSGELWVATLGGLDVLPHGARSFTHFRNDPRDARSLSNNAVAALHRDARGRLWVGTLGGGLDLYDRESRRFTSFRLENGLPSDHVFSIGEDPRGDLWLGTANGLSRFSPDTRDVKNFGRSNGLRSLQFGLGACARTRDGRLLFGTAEGLYVFDPQKVKTDTYVPPVVFTSMRIFGQPVRVGLSIPDPEVHVAYWQNVLSLEFAALDFTVPRGNEYAYKLEGFRREWTALGPKHEVTFTNLDAGEYTLRVRASNSDGVWNDEGGALRIVVTPPVWATWWFRALMALTLAASLGTAYHVRVRRLEARERELTRRVDEAMSNVKVLRGLLPMCAWCKKVRDDRGYWNQIEAYLALHSEADFSHGICPDCARRIGPGPGPVGIEERH